MSGLSPGERHLEADAAHYLSHVHRLRAGDRFVAFDPGERVEAPGEILRVDREAVSVRLGETMPARAVPPLDVTLVQCSGKGDKIDDVVRATTALGVSAVLVAESSRSVARLDAERAEKKRERWRAVALDAARQSGRGDVPNVDGPRPISDVLSAFRDDPAMKLCLDPHATATFASALRANAAPNRVVLLVGPEGGLSDDELALAERAGFVRVRLGPFVLRTELAASAALGALLALYDPST
ncbi:MAG TPA: RsmE family RNA methyltransferase [Polyangiaceae bacterium]|nr:RsmE family RNA methyltransferase [Polyangiaceae bacterium]